MVLEKRIVLGRAGLAVLNHNDFNHWFKSYYSRVIFLSKIWFKSKICFQSQQSVYFKTPFLYIKYSTQAYVLFRKCSSIQKSGKELPVSDTPSRVFFCVHSKDSCRIIFRWKKQRLDVNFYLFNLYKMYDLHLMNINPYIKTHIEIIGWKNIYI